MAGNGPPPNPNAKRQNPRIGILLLPAEGRQGDPPDWPLEGEPSPAEHRAWEHLWSTPQAVAWQRMGWTRTVARYCRVVVLAEEGMAAAWGEARLLEKELGLTPAAMRSLMWQVVEDETAGRRQSDTDPTSARPRRRMRAVDTGS